MVVQQKSGEGACKRHNRERVTGEFDQLLHAVAPCEKFDDVSPCDSPPLNEQ